VSWEHCLLWVVYLSANHPGMLSIKSHRDKAHITKTRADGSWTMTMTKKASSSSQIFTEREIFITLRPEMSIEKLR
jgi:hypothetical protein